MKWKSGRQEGGYQVLTLFSIKLPFKWIKGVDCHVIRYRKGDYIPIHKDRVAGDQSHHRINIILKQCKGGNFYCEGDKRYGPIIYFRPDIMEHGVSMCYGTRYVFSIGWVK